MFVFCLLGTCSAESDSDQWVAINDEGLSHSDTPVPQETSLQSPPTSHGPTFQDDAGGRTLSCNEQDEEEEDVEVDDLLYSPVKVPQDREHGDGLLSIEFSPEQEEEEDTNEIDVTGSDSQ